MTTNSINWHGDNNRRPRVIISISDFDFSKKSVEVLVGSPLEFRLSSGVPLHAEHILEGKSSNANLCFQSPLMQVHPIKLKLKFNVQILLCI